MPPGTLGFRVSGECAWERIAVVTDLDWLWRAFRMFSWMVPGEMRLFHEPELDQATRWLAE